MVSLTTLDPANATKAPSSLILISPNIANEAVVIPLIRKLLCIYLVSGRIEVTEQLLTGAIDFGNGDCDNLTILIFNGEEFPIILGG